MIQHQFKPVINTSSRILILGSFPSVKSRESAFYYMNQNNRFWPLLERIFNDHFTSGHIKDKMNLLEKYHIGLYDVIKACDIEGSKDASITDVEVADVKKLIQGTQVQKIFLNGRKAEELFDTYFPDLKPMAEYLPSTSPANARYQMDDLYEEWKKIKDYV